MDYILKANGLVILFFLFYYLVLKNETFFTSIRFYFIIGILLIIALPIVEIPIYIDALETSFSNQTYAITTTTNSHETASINWLSLLTTIYIMGVVLFSAKFFIQLISLNVLIFNHRAAKNGSYKIIETAKNIAPFSFFNYIIYNKTNYTQDELDQILTHEKIHANQFHSLDILLSHALTIAFWFNPFVWLYKKSVQQNLEFLADNQASNISTNKKLYQITLLKTCGNTYCTSLTNNFNKSLIKKRIIMLNQFKSNTKNQWKYALILPLLVAFIATFSTKVIAQEKKLSEIEEIDNVRIELVINKNSTNESLKKESELFKKEFNIILTFDGIKRNTSNEIFAIKVEAKGKELASNFSTSGIKPIQPIRIAFESNANSISIGNVTSREPKTIHEKHMSIQKQMKNGESNEGYSYYFSDGNKVKWVEKIEIDSLHLNKEYSEKETVKTWVSKDGKEKKFITITTEIKTDDDHQIEIEKDKNENFIIIKKDGETKTKHKIQSNGNAMFIGSDKENALYIIDGKESTTEEFKKISNESIESIDVLKGPKAIEKYGEKAKNGVIIILTKKQ
ncbi:M56 family metallopeptidase [Lutibacter sp.]|uniref:M56 family metallopeptidase n=1 Tax=Lutibacter sp. TaxID=1925666 RepID=UPI002736920C|nr:M56 family metallopeptidase [Lutibacter sp.]MDP3312986.1 M56 family metallopeptidase [Lutibacter sp.]